jgi:hypothetical protein
MHRVKLGAMSGPMRQVMLRTVRRDNELGSELGHAPGSEVTS